MIDTVTYQTIMDWLTAWWLFIQSDDPTESDLKIGRDLNMSLVGGLGPPKPKKPNPTNILRLFSKNFPDSDEIFQILARVTNKLNWNALSGILEPWTNKQIQIPALVEKRPTKK